MNVSKQEFDARNVEVDGAIEKLQTEVRSSYSDIVKFLDRLESHIDDKFNTLNDKFDTLNDKFDKLDAKVDRMDQRLTRLTENVSHMNSNFGARFDVITGQLRLIDQGQFRTEQRLFNLERRVDVLEDKAS